MSMYEELSSLEEYAFDLERHIGHLQQWYTNSEHRDLEVNRTLLAKVKSDLEILTNDCRVKHDEGLCDDSFRFCVDCESFIGDGYVFNGEVYCSECFHEQRTEREVEQMFDREEAYWTAWY